MWNQFLSRENFDDFFRTYAPAAYSSTYNVLGDTTRTEKAVTESFLEVYQRKNSIDQPEELLYILDEALKRQISMALAEYKVTSHVSNGRKLDEFTENSMLFELHKKIDSTLYRVISVITSSNWTSKKHPWIWTSFRNSGISIFLMVEIAIMAFIIFVVATASLRFFSDYEEFVPTSPNRFETSIDSYLVPILPYLPLIHVDLITNETNETSPTNETQNVLENPTGESVANPTETTTGTSVGG